MARSGLLENHEFLGFARGVAVAADGALFVLDRAATAESRILIGAVLTIARR